MAGGGGGGIKREHIFYVIFGKICYWNFAKVILYECIFRMKPGLDYN